MTTRICGHDVPSGTLCSCVDPADKYMQDVEAFMTTLDTFAIEQFGERCADFEPDCICCKVWAIRDRLQQLLVF